MTASAAPFVVLDPYCRWTLGRLALEAAGGGMRMPEQTFEHDEQLAKQVKEALLAQTDSAGIDVQVSARDGTVRLHGVVDALSHKSAA